MNNLAFYLESVARLVVAALLFSAVTLSAAGNLSTAAAGPPKPPLAGGPGAGFRTGAASMVRTLRSGYSVSPIFTAGDTLISSEPETPPFIFAGRAVGLGALAQGDGTLEVYVAHNFAQLEGRYGAVVSRLVLNRRTSGVLAADYLVEPLDGYGALAHSALLDSRVGFLHPYFLLNEWGNSYRLPLVAAVSARDGTTQDLP